MTEAELLDMASVACGEGGFFSTPDDEGHWQLFVTPEWLQALAGLVAEHARLREALEERGADDMAGLLLENVTAPERW